jgi:cytidylate kinase
MTRRVVLRAAETGSCVVVGRGSQHFLRDRNDTLRVFLYAPTEDKVQRLLVRGKTENEAHELVDTVDRERADFIAKYFGVDWPNLPLYHTMINTSIGDGAVVQAIANFMKICDARLTWAG